MNLDIFEFRKRGHGFATLPLRFKYDDINEYCSISKIMDDRSSRIKDFYSQLWFDERSLEFLEATLRPKLVGSPVTLIDDLISSSRMPLETKSTNWLSNAQTSPWT